MTLESDVAAIASRTLWLRARDLSGADGSTVDVWPAYGGEQATRAVAASVAAQVSTSTVPPLSGKSVSFPNQNGLTVGRVAPRDIVSVFSSTTPYSGNLTATLFDGTSSANEWVVPAVTVQVGARYGTAFAATGYTLWGASSGANRPPKDWTFQGSNNSTTGTDGTWTTLDTRTGQNPSTTTGTNFTFSNSTTYTWYRLSITAVQASGEAGLKRFDITGQPTTTVHGGSSGELWMVVKAASSGQHAGPGKVGGATGGGTEGYYPYSDGNVYYDFGSSSRPSFTTPAALSSWHIVRFRKDSAGVMSCTINGTSLHSSNTGAASWADDLYIGSSAPGASAPSLHVAEWISFSSALGSTDATTVNDYLTQTHITASSSSPVSVSAPVLATVEAVPAPVVTAGASASVAAPALAIVAALLVPSVSAGTGVRVDAPALAVSTTVAAPSVTMGGGVTVAAPALGVVAAVAAPTVLAGSSVAVSAPVLAASIALRAPAVTTTALGGLVVAAPHLSLVTAMPEVGVVGPLPDEHATVSLTYTPVGIVSVIPLVPVSPLATAVPVTRLSILAPDLSAEYPAHPAQGEAGAPAIVEGDVGYVQLWISGQNVTNLRDVPTVIRRWESEAPFGDTVAAFEFPQLNPWDKPGTADLTFLRKDAPVALAMVNGSTVRRLWSGFLDARGNGLGEGEDYSWEAKGTFWQAQSQIREPKALTEPVDIGVQFARTMNAVEGRRWATMPETPIGITTMTRGSRDETFWDYAQALLSEAIADDLRQWSLLEVSPGIPRLVLKPAPTTVHATVAYGTPGVDIDLRVDESTRVDRIFMRGIGPKMGGWANVFYPGIELLAAPPYPNTDLSNITSGDTDADTGSGTGVTDWQRRVNELKGFGNPAVSGVMSSAWVAVIDDLQRFVGVTADGSLGPQTWNATFDRALRGVDLTPLRLPLASKAAANKWLYTATGVKLGPNPAYDSTLVVRDVAIDIGPGKTKATGRALARKLLGIYGTAAANGQIVWTTDPRETDRTHLSHLTNVKVTGFEGETRIVQVASKSVELEAGDDGPVYVVTTRVDERARDAMAVEDLLEQRRSAQPDPSRRPGNPSKASRQVSDQRTPWDSESPCGVLRRTAVNGASGLWSVVTVPFAEVGKLAGIRLTSTRPFAFALFASQRITENKLAAIVGNPFSTSDPWRDEKGQLDAYGIIEAWGEQGNACGYSPKTETDAGAAFTGDFILDTPVDYWTETVPYVSVAIYMRGGSGWISGEFIPAYEP